MPRLAARLFAMPSNECSTIYPVQQGPENVGYTGATSCAVGWSKGIRQACRGEAGLPIARAWQRVHAKPGSWQQSRVAGNDRPACR